MVHVVQHSVDVLRRTEATSKDCGGVDVVSACDAAAGCGVDWQGAGIAARGIARSAASVNEKLKRWESGWCGVRVVMVGANPSE
jgi:hypothetical protein